MEKEVAKRNMGGQKNNRDPAQIPDVNPGSFRAQISVRHVKGCPLWAPIREVVNSGVFCQTADFILPPKLG